jgi:hypothetical protein
MEIWKPGHGQDPARYLIDVGTVSAPGKHSAGMLAHARPYIASDNRLFVFPVGVEGFRRTGSAALGLHRYLGSNTVDGVTTHYDEARIELSGTFPGISAQDNMIACMNILVSKPKAQHLVLYTPGVFDNEQYVLAESWEFTHDQEDRTHSIEYTISFVRLGVGKKVTDKPGKPPPPNPTAKSVPKGKTARTFVVRDGARTFRAIAKIVYGNANYWQQLVILNQAQFAPKGILEIPTYQIPTYRWAIGTKFRY